MADLSLVLAALQELESDSSLPKNVLAKISNTVKLLQSNEEHSIKVAKALDELSDLTQDCNMQGYTRSQIFEVVSQLEALMR